MSEHQLPARVASPEAMVDALRSVVDITGGAKTVALLSDRRARPITAFERTGTISCDDLLDLCDICAGEGDGDDGDVDVLVLVSWRPGSGVDPTDADHECWHTMLARTI